MRNRACLIAVGVGVALLLAVVGVVVAIKRSAVPVPDWVENPPADNAFDDYVRAGELLQSRGAQPDLFLQPGFDPAERAKLVDENADVLDILRQAADKECAVVPMPPEANDERPRQIRHVARLIAVAVQERSEAGEADEAVAIGLDGVAMGVNVERGPLIWMLVGGACETIAARSLDKAADQCSADTAREAARRLEEFDGRTPSTDEVRGAERHYYRAPLIVRLAGPDINWVRAERKQTQFAAQRRALATKLAIIAYREDNGALPAGLTALVPEYLSAVPEDPFAQAPLSYRQTSDGFVVYSVGPDIIDDGGQPLTYHTGQDPIPGDVGAGVPADLYHPKPRRGQAPPPPAPPPPSTP